MDLLTAHAEKFVGMGRIKPGHISDLKFNPTKYHYLIPYYIWILIGYDQEYWFFDSRKEAEAMKMLRDIHA